MSPDDLRELFSTFRSVDVRRLFGGAGVFVEGTMFALVHGGVIYLRVDSLTAAPFDRENLPPFTYSARGATRALSAYRRMPDRLYDDGDELAAWSRDALAAAQRGKARKRPSGAGTKPNRKKARKVAR